MRKCLLLIVAAMVCFGAFARGGVPGVRTEWGVVAGVDHPMAKFSMGQSSAQLNAKTGFAAGLHLGLRIVGVLGIQPEILYSHNRILLNDQAKGFDSVIRCNRVQIPLLVSLKFGFFRINAGPVLTVMDNPIYTDFNNERVFFGATYPTISYAAGVAVSLFDRLLIDARVQSGFKAMENCLSYGAKAQTEYIKTTMFNAQLKVGILF